MTDKEVKCDNCSVTLKVQSCSAGLSDVVPFYCETDGTVLEVPVQGKGLDEAFGGRRPSGAWTEEDFRTLEARLIPCPCGGMFKHDALPRCPKCGGRLDFKESYASEFWVTAQRIDGEKQPWRKD